MLNITDYLMGYHNPKTENTLFDCLPLEEKPSGFFLCKMDLPEVNFPDEFYILENVEGHGCIEHFIPEWLISVLGYPELIQKIIGFVEE